MQLLKRIALPALLALGSSFALVNPASAQLYGPGSASLSTNVFVAAGNLNTSLPYIPIWPVASKSDSLGAAISVSGGQSFSGNDSQGNPQTMSLSGTGNAWAQYGVLHTSASGEIDNPYYNASNPDFYDGVNPLNLDGSPQYLQVVGQTLFEDTLTLNPFSDPVVKIKYVFHLEGNVTDDQHDYAYLAFNAGNNGTVFFTPTNGLDWVTPDWDVTPGAPIPLSGNFGAVFGANTNYYNTPEGQTVSGTSDFYDTLTLTGIQLLDANGNQVNGVHYLTASGSQYNVLGGLYGSVSSVPEPGSLALLLGFGLTGTVYGLKRRRSRS